MLEKPPMEWIDKLFSCMEEFYGERWTRLMKHKDIYKTVWQSGLQGCTYDEIRGVLVYLKRAAQNPSAIPPHLMEFYRFAKRTEQPRIDYTPAKSTASAETARKHIDHIKQQLNKNCST